MRTKRLPLVSVPNPCDVSWDTLTGTDAVRSCERCERTIHNLSAMTRAEAERLLAESSGERLCVTYSRGPNGEIVTTDRPARFSFGRIATASTAAATALTLSLSTPAAAVPRRGVAYQSSQTPAASSAPRGGLRGTIRYNGREQGKGTPEDPLEGVRIYARNWETGAEFTAKSSADGTYELLLPKGRYDVSMGSDGFLGCAVQGIDIGNKVLRADAKLDLQPLGEVFDLGLAKNGVGAGCHNTSLKRIAHKR